MGETTGQIETHIRNTREELSENLNELEQKVKSVTDWRQHFEKYPGVFLAAALGGGLLLSRIGRQGRGAPIAQGVPDREAAGVANPRAAASGPLQDTVNEIKGALIGVVATQAKSFISKLVPGFEEQLGRAGTKNSSGLSSYRA